MKYSGILNSCFMVLLWGLSSLGFSQYLQHEYINSMRSSLYNYIFVNIGLEGEFASLNIVEKQLILNVNTLDKTQWKGYGIKNEVGIELIKFVQFYIGHSALNLKSYNGDLRSLSGSRLNSGINFVFNGPLGDLQFGGGVLVSKLDYQKFANRASVLGSGYYYLIGYNYFLSTSVSINTQIKQIEEKLTRDNGDSNIKSIKGNSISVSSGFSLWL